MSTVKELLYVSRMKSHNTWVEMLNVDTLDTISSFAWLKLRLQLRIILCGELFRFRLYFLLEEWAWKIKLLKDTQYNTIDPASMQPAKKDSIKYREPVQWLSVPPSPSTTAMIIPTSV